jgi:hypothetical protein
VNIGEANAVNDVLRALLQQPYAPHLDLEGQAERLTTSVTYLAGQAHKALGAGITGVEAAAALAEPEPLPILDGVVTPDGRDLYRLGENVEGVFVCYTGGNVGFLAKAIDGGEPNLHRLMEMLSDAAVQVVRAAGLDPDQAGA